MYRDHAPSLAETPLFCLQFIFQLRIEKEAYPFISINMNFALACFELVENPPQLFKKLGCLHMKLNPNLCLTGQHLRVHILCSVTCT